MPLGQRLRPAIVRQLGLARCKRRDVDQTPNTPLPHGVDHGHGSPGIAGYEALAIRGVHNARDMDDHIGITHQRVERCAIFERAGHPFQPRAGWLRLSGDGRNMMASFKSLIQCFGADKACRAGHGNAEFHGRSDHRHLVAVDQHGSR